jgi:uncharacterized membrane protein
MHEFGSVGHFDTQILLLVGLLAGMQSIYCPAEKSWVSLHVDLHQTTLSLRDQDRIGVT